MIFWFIISTNAVAAEVRPDAEIIVIEQIKSATNTLIVESGAQYVTAMSELYDRLSRDAVSNFGRLNGLARGSADRVRLQQFFSQRAAYYGNISRRIGGVEDFIRGSQKSVGAGPFRVSRVGVLIDAGLAGYDEYRLRKEVALLRDNFPNLNIPSIPLNDVRGIGAGIANGLTFGLFRVNSTSFEAFDQMPTDARRLPAWMAAMEDIANSPEGDDAATQSPPPLGLLQYLKLKREAFADLEDDFGLTLFDEKYAWIENWSITGEIGDRSRQVLPRSRQYDHRDFPELISFDAISIDEMELYDGIVNEFVVLSGNDLQNEQTVLIAEFASPDDDTVPPGVDGGGDEGGGGDDGGQDGGRDDQVPATNTVRSFVAAVSLDTEGPETGWQFVASEGLSNDDGELSSVDINVPAGQISVTTTGSPRGSQYSHLQYGASTDTTTFVRNGQTFEASNAHWLYGNFSPSSNLALRTGTASYAGKLFGHAYDVQGPDLNAAFDSVSGDFTLSVDFSTNQASLEGNIVGLGSEPLSFSGGLNRDFYDLNEGERPSVVVSDITDVGLIGITTQANLAFPVELDVPRRTSSSGQDDGYLYGSFFGDNASEFGGTFAFALDGTLATGVAVASRSDTLGTGFAIFETADDTVARRGGITVTELNNSTLSAETTDNSLNELEGVTVNAADLDNGSFNYVSWGSWNDSGSYLGQDVSSGTIAFGQITPEENMPSGGTRNFGTATANSQVAGVGADGSSIDGSVQLTAEFGASRGGLNGVEVNGSFDFDRNGNDWASGTFSTENDVLRTNGFIADMTVDQGGDGRMFGNFAGPNAEEVFGNWQLNGVNDADLGAAQGIFRAN